MRHISTELRDAVSVADVASYVGIGQRIFFEIAACVEVLVEPSSVHADGDAVLLHRKRVQRRNEPGVLYVAQREPVLGASVHMPEVGTRFHADTMPVASVRLACIRIAFDARIVAKHIRVAFEAPRAHDDASLRTVRFAARHNARHFAR